MLLWQIEWIFKLKVIKLEKYVRKLSETEARKSHGMFSNRKKPDGGVIPRVILSSEKILLNYVRSLGNTKTIWFVSGLFP